MAEDAASCDETASFPRAHIAHLRDLGLLALTVPTIHGGQGGGLSDAARIVGAVGGGEAATGLLLAMHYLMHGVLRVIRPPVYSDVARDTVVNHTVLNALQAEPDMGSAMRGGMPGTIARVGADGGWRIDGAKAWATGSGVVGAWLVLARTDDERPRVGMWLVPADAPGLRVEPTWNHAGLRASASHSVYLEDVVVAADACLSLYEPGSDGLQKQSALIQIWNGILLAALYDGIARAGRDWLLRFLNERTPSSLGAALATVPRIQSVVGEIENLLAVNRVLIDDAARRADSDEGLPGLHAQFVKMRVTENAVTALEKALSVSGNHGLDRHHPLERHFRDSLCGRVHGPQSDSVLVALGRQALGS